VVTFSTVLQPPFRRWILTLTLDSQASKSEDTAPLAIRCRRSDSVTVRAWSVGAPVTVKFVALVAVPELVVTAIGPVTALLGTVAVIWVGESTVKVVAATPPKVTDVAPVNDPPVMVTTVPTLPLVGVKLLMHGPDPVVTVKLVVLVAVPSESVTAIGPVVAPAGTVAVICVFELTVNVVAAVPLNVTDDTALGASWYPLPVMMTCVPTGPHVGLKDVIVGAAANAGGIPSSSTVAAVITDTKSIRGPTLFFDLVMCAPPPSPAGRPGSDSGATQRVRG
jgi:hypothetical protein